VGYDWNSDSRLKVGPNDAWYRQIKFEAKKNEMIQKMRWQKEMG